MAKDRILDVNYEMGFYEVFRYDELTGESTIKTMFFAPHTDAILEANKRKQNEGRNAFVSKTKGETDSWHAARIPASVAMDWLVNKGIDCRKPEHWPEVKRLLNDPEWKYLRTGDFTI